VNWCPKLGTVLANEEVINGLSERGSHPVVRRPLRQWVLQITKYAGVLEEGLSQLKWPEGTLQAQRQWIGRSEGALIKFGIPGGNASTNIEVFTTRPDTLLGVTYLVLAPEHPLLSVLTHPDAASAVQRYVEQSASKSDLDRLNVANKKKTGVPLGTAVIHPLTGAEVPLWCADYVLGGYGTGAVMAVPAHDERDFEFAKEFNLPIKQVVEPTADTLDYTLPFLGQGIACNCGPHLDGKSSAEVSKALIAELIASQKGEHRVMYKLRDWVFSRQRFWGEPIPIYFPVEFPPDDSLRNPRDPASRHRICYESPIPVDDADLPLQLPVMEDFSPSDDPQGCLAKAAEWRYFQRDGKWFARETNTMPQVGN
jgi:leucyl-tRNA synthetase